MLVVGATEPIRGELYDNIMNRVRDRGTVAGSWLDSNTGFLWLRMGTVKQVDV